MTNATSGAGTTYPSRIPEPPSRRMPLVEQELLTLPEYPNHHHNECRLWRRDYFPFQNTLVTITTNATSVVGTNHPSRMHESPSRRMSLVEQELLTLHNTCVTITTNATSGAGITYHSRIPESPSRRMPLVEQKLRTLPEYLNQHHNECHWWSRNCFPFQNTRVTITTNATSGAGTTYPSSIPQLPSRRMSLVEQELSTLPEYLSHHHDECH